VKGRHVGGGTSTEKTLALSNAVVKLIEQLSLTLFALISCWPRNATALSACRTCWDDSIGSVERRC
jgi:hypothetical protein